MGDRMIGRSDDGQKRGLAAPRSRHFPRSALQPRHGVLKFSKKLGDGWFCARENGGPFDCWPVLLRAYATGVVRETEIRLSKLHAESSYIIEKRDHFCSQICIAEIASAAKFIFDCPVSPQAHVNLCEPCVGCSTLLSRTSC